MYKSFKYSDWENHILSISEDLEGSLKVVKSPSLGDQRDYLCSECLIEYKNGIISINQLFIKEDSENGYPQKLIFTFELINNFDFHLSINHKDFFDRIFSSKRIKLNDEVFDKQFTIQSNDKNIALSIFDNFELKKLILDNETIVFNISTEDGKTKITLKNMLQKVYSIEEYKDYLRNMKIIIDILNK
jgi:hypothetical protein